MRQPAHHMCNETVTGLLPVSEHKTAEHKLQNTYHAGSSDKQGDNFCFKRHFGSLVKLVLALGCYQYIIYAQMKQGKGGGIFD